MDEQPPSAGVATILPPLALADIINTVPVGILVVDAAGRIELANPALEQMFGYARDALKGTAIEQLMPMLLQNGYQALLEGAKATPAQGLNDAARDLAGVSRDGRTFPIEIGLSRLQTADGMKITITVTDISEIKRRQQALSRQIFDSASFGMILVDGNGCILKANKEMEHIFGHPYIELVGQRMEMLVPRRHSGRHPDLRKTYNSDRTARKMGAGRDITGLHSDGTEIPLDIALAPIDTEEGGATLAIISDISARKTWEIKLKLANANLDEFSYVASHDLKSPLRGIADLLNWIEEGVASGDGASVEKNLARARLRIGRMEQIIEDLLRYARAGEMSTATAWLDLAAVIAGVVDLLAVPPEFAIHIGCDVSSMMAARTPLETVLRNLVSNAVKHHDRGGGRIDISVTEDDAYCVFTVTDDGPGVPAPARERIFRLFQTLSVKDRDGSGIGLAVVKRLVEAHGGRIIVDSTDGARGTRFRFWWPRFARKTGDTNDRA